MRSGPTLSDAECEALYRVACGLYQQAKASGSFTTDVCEGRISTRGKTVMLASISGVEFEAEMDLERGSTKARFIVSARDLAIGPAERMSWRYTIGHWPSEEESEDEILN